MAGEAWGDMCAQTNTCALAGGAAFFAGVPEAAMMVNGPLWCYFYALRQLERPCPNVGKRFFCTQPDNQAVVFGTEDCLLETLSMLKTSMKPEVLFIENSCAVSLIGDDVAGIAAQADLSCPAVCMDSGGMRGGFWEGYREAALAYVKTLPPKARQTVRPKTVNLLGCTVGYYQEQADVKEMERLLALVGYNVLTRPGAGSSPQELAELAQAEVNLVVHSELGLELARYLEENYGMPYVTLASPYGVQGTVQWLDAFCDAVKLGEDLRKTYRDEGSYWAKHIQNATLEMRRLWGDIWFERVAVAGPSSVALALGKALRREWADAGKVTVICHDGAFDGVAPSEADLILNGREEVQLVEKSLRELGEDDLLWGSSQENYFLRREGEKNVLYQPVALPAYEEVLLGERPFAGFQGACHLAERLWNGYVQKRCAKG